MADDSLPSFSNAGRGGTDPLSVITDIEIEESGHMIENILSLTLTNPCWRARFYRSCQCQVVRGRMDQSQNPRENLTSLEQVH